MSVVTRPDLFPASQAVKLFALPTPQGGELLRRNQPRYIATVNATLVTGTNKLTVVGGDIDRLEAGAILSGTSIPSETKLVKLLEPNPESVALGPGQTAVWEMSANAEATVEVAELVLAYPPLTSGGAAISAYNPENWKVPLTKIGEPTVAASGELIVASTVEGQGAGPALCFASVSGRASFLTAQAHASLLVKVKTTNTAILPANPLRQGLNIENTGATNVMYLGLGKAAVLKEGIGPLIVNGSWDGRLGNELWRGSIFGIAETGEVTASVAEF
jgi:hypothetical protein